jgi:ATP-dependent 26S proteasome regulatory subunit
VNILASYIDALHPIIYINHFDFVVIDEAISRVGKSAKCVEYNNALGLIDFYSKSPMRDCGFEEFLRLTMDDGFEQETYLVLKDVHEELKSPKIVSLLKRIAENNLYKENYSATIFILSETIVIPKELENYITVFDIPLPSVEEILTIIQDFIVDMNIIVDQNVIDDIALSFKGLNEFQIKQILNLAYQDGGCIDKDDKLLILKEKEQFIKKSGMLEIVNFTETINDIGGLDNLKEWLSRKAKVFENLDKALKFGVDVPKGIMIIGMPGCGKSLTAKATASLFEIPLVRLDVGRLLGKYVGESEENMRKALKLSEAISPCVLWIDEIEKAFAGIGGDGGGNDVTTRLFGQFLTWMQEKENTVIIVATANDISKMPPEFLRKGRFDELFFVDLPNGEERRRILEIHLKKRKKWNKEIDTIALIKETEGFNGADLEAVIKDTIEKAFIHNIKKITTENLLESVRDTKSISSTLKEKIEEIKSTIEKIDIKPASKEDTKSISSTLKEKIEEIKCTIEKIDIKPASKEDTINISINEKKPQVTEKGNEVEAETDSKSNKQIPGWDTTTHFSNMFSSMYGKTK